jgi:hypothetical protein
MCFEPILNTTHERAPVARSGKISYGASVSARRGGFLRRPFPHHHISLVGMRDGRGGTLRSVLASLMSEKMYS